MPTKQMASAVPADVVVALALDPPVSGCHAGGGIHVTIPPDWFARCNAGQTVPGCNHAKLESDGFGTFPPVGTGAKFLYVSDAAQSRTGNPAYTTGLVAGDLSAFITKLSTAVVVSAAAADAQAEIAP